ncbi:transcriptional regulator, MarR family with acetyltransferase activity [Catenulispora acidiphila DSM 44928]|uniref:Transcriptional regulator, MarR family with acetyltransferase activity n=1 Tax=Catenulispora acidiphila (strain DSM 44928 / JCM 14897 / NBRC 102108 / NRRL B-24433 / ID139908) TaxID=479433 RepID=C7QHM8_CATAD|nr:helix-turn-helix domain-containing GNAT family N-acetyltransferase [Catenulispora acidiphila]ACU71053.1 transcriptional regulator, MarR family with acetyltransferase activity [Catenulispora acidiphila DSM 44928]
MVDLAPAVAAVRSFNRSYTKVIGVLEDGLLKSPYTLTEVRVLLEIAHAGPEGSTVVRIREDLGLDPGYLSRILARFDSEGMVVKGRAADDARRGTVQLTERGRGVFSGLDERSSEQVGEWLSRLGAGDRGRLVEAMGQIGGLLGFAENKASASQAPPSKADVVLRAPRPGDYGWVVERHGALYASERDFDETFEADVARIVADYAGSHDAEREAFWIAEVQGRRVGCVACVRRPTEDGVDTAQLRILLVDPSARGFGVGRRLVDECLEFARKVGYQRMMLFTVDGLSSAHRIYRARGFEIVRQEAVEMWGHHLVEQEWELEL